MTHHIPQSSALRRAEPYHLPTEQTQASLSPCFFLPLSSPFLPLFHTPQDLSPHRQTHSVCECRPRTHSTLKQRAQQPDKSQKGKTHLSLLGLWNSNVGAGAIDFLSMAGKCGDTQGLRPDCLVIETGHFSEHFSNSSDGNKGIQRRLGAMQHGAAAGRVVPIAPPLPLQGFLAQDHVAGKGEQGWARDLGPQRFPPLGPAKSRGVGMPRPLCDRCKATETF